MLQRELTARQFMRWMVYDSIEPLGFLRSDYHAAQVVAAIANILRDAQQKPQPYRPEDFLLKFVDVEESEKPKQTWQQQKAICMAIAAAFSTPGKKPDRKKRKQP